MKQAELYKFIHENNIEYHWHDHQVIAFIPFRVLSEFADLQSYRIFEDGGIECNLNHDCICIQMREVVEFYGLDLSSIFDQEEK